MAWSKVFFFKNNNNPFRSTHARANPILTNSLPFKSLGKRLAIVNLSTLATRSSLNGSLVSRNSCARVTQFEPIKLSPVYLIWIFPARNYKVDQAEKMLRQVRIIYNLKPLQYQWISKKKNFSMLTVARVAAVEPSQRNPPNVDATRSDWEILFHRSDWLRQIRLSS